MTIGNLNVEERVKYAKYSQQKADELDEQCYHYFCRRYASITTDKKSRRRRGPKKAKVTSNDYIRSRFISIFDTYVRYGLRVMSENKADTEKLIPGRGWHEGELLSKMPDLIGIDKNSESMLNLGGWLMLAVVRSIVLEVMLRDSSIFSDRLHNVRFDLEEMDRQEVLLQKEGFSKEAIAQFRKELVHDLPNDLLRKVRPPKFTSLAIAKFISAAKECDGLPLVRDVAKRLDRPVSEVMELYNEAVRQRKKISLGKCKKGQFFLLD
jgi:hypothetical protein